VDPLGWLNEVGHKLRYGVSSAEKGRLASAHTLESPGATSTPDQAERYAAGYLFAKQWPNLAAAGGQAAADRLHFGPVEQMRRGLKMVPGLGELIVDADSPELQSFATTGGSKALADLAAESKNYRKTADFRREADAAAKRVSRKPAARY